MCASAFFMTGWHLPAPLATLQMHNQVTGGAAWPQQAQPPPQQQIISVSAAQWAAPPQQNNMGPAPSMQHLSISVTQWSSFSSKEKRAVHNQALVDLEAARILALTDPWPANARFAKMSSYDLDGCYGFASVCEDPWLKNWLAFGCYKVSASDEDTYFANGMALTIPNVFVGTHYLWGDTFVRHPGTNQFYIRCDPDDGCCTCFDEGCCSPKHITTKPGELPLNKGVLHWKGGHGFLCPSVNQCVFRLCRC
jgi:hypothetical protein